MLLKKQDEPSLRVVFITLLRGYNNTSLNNRGFQWTVAKPKKLSYYFRQSIENCSERNDTISLKMLSE